MKKNQYICPSIQILGFNCEGMLLDVSQTQTNTPPGTGDNPGGPGSGGFTDKPEEVPAKPFDGWGTWDWDE